jgi:hypothetical protein
MKLESVVPEIRKPGNTNYARPKDQIPDFIVTDKLHDHSAVKERRRCKLRIQNPN